MTIHDPRRDPSWEPPPRRKVLGISIPPESRLPESIRSPSKRTKAGIAGGAAMTIALAVWHGLPALVSAFKSEPVPPPPVVDCATQESVDQLSIRLQKLEQRQEYDFQLSCALNGGNPGPGAVCEPHYFFESRTPPPTYRSDRLRK